MTLSIPVEYIYTYINDDNMGKCTTEKFIEKARKKYGDRYDYSKVEYKGYNVKVCIICPIHGEFWITPDAFLHKNGCHKCGLEKMRKSLTKTTEQFIEEAKKIHGDKYDYSKVNYIDGHTKVCIICPKHGEFWQTPRHHILGFKCGCSKCCVSKLEQFVIDTLNNKKIEFIYECGKKDLSWLGRQRLDIYIPQMKLCVECQGIQHFKPESFGGKKDKDENLKNNIKNDIKKFNKCVENGVKTIYVVDDKKDVIDNVIYKYGNVYDKNEFIKLFENETQSFISLSI